MDEAKKEARRKELAVIAEARRSGELVPPPVASGAELDWDLDTTAPIDQAGSGSETEEPVHSLSQVPADAPSLQAVDSGWDDEEEEEEEDEPEPELPDERLDPVAYAAAKAAQAERIEARRERKRAKDAAKKARRKARAEEIKSKQKGKSRKTRPPTPPPAQKIKRTRQVAKTATPRAERSDSMTEIEPSPRTGSRKSQSPMEKQIKRAAVSTRSIGILAVAFFVFAAAVLYAWRH